MKLTVFGATGGIGQEIVKQALSAGHVVTSVVRDPSRFTVSGERLTVVRAALTDPQELREAVAGRDAVLSGLGARSRKDAGTATRLTRTVLRAMEAGTTRRLVVVSAAPVGPHPARQPVVDRIVGRLVSAALKPVYVDLRAMEDELAGSATDWTSVRPPKLTDAPLTGTYRKVVGGTPRSGRTIARADVAHAMLAVLDDPATVKQGVGVAY
ncbi:NAD(P)-dependent oxidoreductase [Streptomyces sp. NPDC091272]|uniref:NAD(P)-dependent oxidoreductase n=1 Tax=Streptomyces sp. NPDC091272 TaxID=3365981 RepID=UPI0038258377